MASLGFFGDLGQFAESLFGAEPTWDDYKNGYDPNGLNWANGFFERAVNNANERFEEFKNGQVGDYVSKVLGNFSGDTDLKNNAYLQYLSQAFNDYTRVSTQMYNADEAKKAFDRQWAIQQEAQRFNAEQAELNYLRNLEASNTAVQRQVADLRKAGLNPYLAYSQGGAPMTSSQSASVGVSNSGTASMNNVSTSASRTTANANALASVISTIANTAVGLAKLWPKSI